MSSIRPWGPFRYAGDPWRFLAALALVILVRVPILGQDRSDAATSSAWSGSASLRAMSRLSQYGLDAAPERMTFLAGAAVSHDAGFSISASTALQPSPWTAQRLSLAGEYELALSEAWGLSVGLGHAWYPATTTNPLANSPVSGSLALDYDGEIWSVGVDVDRYFGGDGATYASLSSSAFISGDGFSLLPMASLSFGSQQVATSSLKRAKGGRPSIVTSTTSVTGLSSIDAMVLLLVPLGDGWSASLMPGVLYTPSDLATTSTRFIWSVGIRRRIEF